MPPVTVSPWRSLRLADRYSPVCPQQSPLRNISSSSNETESAAKYITHGRLEALKKMESFLVNQSEDCLYLNIFTPYSSEYKTATQYESYVVFFFLAAVYCSLSNIYVQYPSVWFILSSAH